MKKVYTISVRLLCILFFLCAFINVNAQTTLSTTASFANNNGSGTVTFNFENTNSYDVIITGIEGVTGTAGANTAQLWFKTTPVSGAPGAISNANGWTMAASGTFTGVANTTTTVTQTFLSNISFTVPAGTTYGIAITAFTGTSTSSQRYSTISAGTTTISAGGCNLITGTNIGYAGGAPPTAPANTPRGWIGKIIFEAASPCITPPTPGTSTATPSGSVCTGTPVLLGLTGNSGGMGQTYIWQTASSAAGPYTNISSSSGSSNYTINPTVSAYYRAAVTCSGNTAYSDPVQVIVPAAFPGGTYTIDGGSPTGGTNFQTFTDAVNAIACGISGSIVFNVAPGTYTEHITIPQVGGASATNTITFNGNGATLSYNTSDANNRAAIILNGADHVIIDSLMIDVSAGTYGWGIVLTNQADSNIIRKCTIINNTASTATNYIGIVINGSASTTATSGNNGNGNLITGNTITGGYYGFYVYGSTAPYNKKNIISSNIVQEFYSYGIYFYGQDSITISKNEITRPARTTVTTTYGIYVSTNTNVLIEKNRIHNLFDGAPTSASAGYPIYNTASGSSVSQPNRIENNLIYNINNGAGTEYGIYGAGYNNNNYYHNTVVLDHSAATAGTTYGMYTYGTGVNVKNNIVYITRSGTGIKYCLYFSTTGVASSNNNVLYMGSTAGTNAVGYYNTARATFADWQATGYDANGSGTDPVFTGGGDYTPTSPVINNIGAAGLGVTTDINDVVRGVSPDPGAIEFNIPGTDAAINWVSPVMPVTAGLKTITVGITNTSSSDVINSINLSYTDGSAVQTQNFTGLNLAAGASQNLSFTTQYNVTANVGFTAYINSVNGSTDLSQANDTTRQSLCFAMKGVYTINQNGAASATNFTSFAAAISALSCGGIDSTVVLNVQPGSGPYMEKVVIPVIAGTTASHTVTINGNGETLLYNTSDAANRTAITLNGTDHLVIDSLVIDVSAGTYGWGIVLMNQADSNIIRKCTIINNTTATTTNYMNILINGSATATATTGNNGNGNLVTGNTFTGGYYGVYLYGSTTPYNKGNVISNNLVQEFYGYGVYMYGQDSVTIRKNEITRPTRSAVTTTYVIYVSTNTNVLIEKNRIHNLFDAASTSTLSCYPVYIIASGVSASQPNRAENNLIYNINNGGGLIYGIYGAGYNNWNYYHNTIVLDHSAATAGTTYGMYVYGTAVNVKNNIVFINRGGTGTKYCLYYSATGVTSSNNNVLWMASTGGTTNSIGYYNAGYATLSAWQAANGSVYDQQSVSVDPVFVNPSATPADYTPTVSAVNNIGIPVGVTQDILDSARSTTAPDPGAYEFSNLTAGINMAADGLIAPVVTAKGCYTSAETVTVRIRNSSLSAIDFSVNPVTVTVNVTGASTQTLNYTVNTGTLASDSTMNITMPSTLNMTVPGTYTFNASTSVAGDANTSNDAMLPVDRTTNALTAGTASGPSDYCVTAPVNPTLSSSGYNGYSGLQWLQSTSASGGYTAISGATTSPYTVTTAPTQTMYYRLVAGCGTLTDTSSVITVTYNNPQVLTTTPASRCGTGSVILGATGSTGTTMEWYTTATGGTPLATGNTFNTPSLSTTTTYYVAANISGGSSGAAPIQVTEMDLGTNDQLEIQNVSGSPVDVTGWKVAVSDNYTNINTVNANVQTLSGVMNPGEIKTWTDLASAPNYWGSNILWNPGAYPTYTGWAAILDNNNNLVDIVFLNWPSASIQAANIVINGVPVTIGSKWSGNGIDQTTVAATQSVSRQGNMDNNSASDFAIVNLSIGTSNPGMTLPFAGFGCPSTRTAVTATVNPTASNAAGAAGTTECAAKTVSGTTEFNYTDCDLITTINPSGASPVSGNVNACVKIDNSVQTAPTGEPYVQRHFDITPATNASTATSTITLYFLQSEFNAFNASAGTYGLLPTGSSDAAGIARLRITQYNGTGTAPGNYTGTAVQINPADANIVWNSTLSRWEITFDATGSGGFYVHTGSFALPVTLINFKGEIAGEINKLSWTTSTETNNSGFELERSADGRNFSKLTFVATKATNGNSTVALNYSYDDARPLAGNSYYRLKQTDKDGKFSYSNIVMLSRKVTDVVLTSVYPNPATKELNLVITSPRAEKLTVIVTDLTGKVIMQRPVSVVMGENQEQVNVQQLAQGTYIIKAVCANGCETAVHRFVKQ